MKVAPTDKFCKECIYQHILSRSCSPDEASQCALVRRCLSSKPWVSLCTTSVQGCLVWIKKHERNGKARILFKGPWKCGGLNTRMCIRNNLSLWVRNPVRNRILAVPIYVPLLSEVVRVDICWTVLKLCVIKVWQSSDMLTTRCIHTTISYLWAAPLKTSDSPFYWSRDVIMD